MCSKADVNPESRKDWISERPITNRITIQILQTIWFACFFFTPGAISCGQNVWCNFEWQFSFLKHPYSWIGVLVSCFSFWSDAILLEVCIHCSTSWPRHWLERISVGRVWSQTKLRPKHLRATKAPRTCRLSFGKFRFDNFQSILYSST